MDYFRVLNLKREPFSNTPDPELFYPSLNRVECLQWLEMSIRLKRGLNVVLGEVGTGKTTLCRKLIQQISNSAGKEPIDLHLILDPSFTSTGEFLSVIAGYFGLIPCGESIDGWSDRQLKESIKNYLLSKGAEEGKIVALLIDEGQKLPDYCLEILREFLNFETNDFKLLQIVIFAQQEFREKIGGLANLANRINLCYSLTQLGFRETCSMIEYRIKETSVDGAGRVLFTLPGLFAVYNATGGNPRSINMLCHHVMLALIIQNRVKAGWPLVRSCAGRVAIKRRRTVNLRLAFVLIILMGSLSFLVFTYYGPLLKSASSAAGLFQAVSEGPPFVRSRPQSDASASVENKNALSFPWLWSIGNHQPPAINNATTEEPQAVKAQSQAAAYESGETEKAPSVLGQWSIKKGQTLRQVFDDIFASFDLEAFRKFVRANPGIENINLVQTGEIVIIPAIPASRDNIPKKAFIEVGRARTLTEAYALFRSHSGNMMLFPFWNRREGLVFALLVKKPFNDRQAALEALKQLSPLMTGDAKVLDAWDDDTVFYHNPEDRS
ncbi:MAG: AAA family ATPase [Dissulfurispiraceae bacterium]|jgi:general secretion pathway protein A